MQTIDASWFAASRKRFHQRRPATRTATSWNRDRVTCYRLHPAVYGQRRDFEPYRDSSAAYYGLHNRAVVEYFRDRPGDLPALCATGYEWLLAWQSF